jgi:hypothetical protein
MRVATQEKTIPSCRVDKSLLQEIERYMMAFFEAGGHFRVAVKYARGATGLVTPRVLWRRQRASMRRSGLSGS